jgi:hypothetical protein
VLFMRHSPRRFYRRPRPRREWRIRLPSAPCAPRRLRLLGRRRPLRLLQARHHSLQERDQRFELLPGEGLRQRVQQLDDQALARLQIAAAFGRERDLHHAAIALGALSPHQAFRLEVIDNAGQGAQVMAGLRAERGRRQAIEAAQVCNHHPLREGDPLGREAPLGQLGHQAPAALHQEADAVGGL